MYFHSISPFFVKVMSSSGNVWAVNRIQHICNTAIHKSHIYGLLGYTNALKEIISHKCVFTPQTLVWGVFYINGGRINIISNNQSGKIIKVVKAAINKAKICKKPIAGYDKIIQNQPSSNNTPKTV